MLNKLEARFRLAGYKNLHFIILSVQSNNTQDDPNSVNKLKTRKSNRTMNISENLKNLASNVTVLDADADDGENDYFHDFNIGSAYVFDQCSRLAYIIYYPWSSIQRPYVKASILSTIYDAPCGECDVSRKFIYQLAIMYTPPTFLIRIYQIKHTNFWYEPYCRQQHYKYNTKLERVV